MDEGLQGTNVGWNVRTGKRATDLCFPSGSYVPFAARKAERIERRDSHLSLEEWYKDHAGFVHAVETATGDLIKVRLLLPRDAAFLVKAAQKQALFRGHLVGAGRLGRLGGVEDVMPMSALDKRTGVGREPSRRVELLTGMTGRRRSWSLEQKLAIVSEAQGYDNLTELARRHDIRTSQLYTWRRELRYALEAAGTKNTIIEPHFVPVVADREESPRRHTMAIEVEVDGAVVRISRTAEARQITAVVQALRQTR